ncbi:hypothetical protein MTR67_035291 [Solanum verrucosum]|uniref:HECT domain-containing protein n=1 Tax=Solanum verrucosum TaxID=315347 RepID=A0AAF0UA70_SOLVR|nr:hypothetical protein MTR67_035291 [Solanum verrucosum]
MIALTLMYTIQTRVVLDRTFFLYFSRKDISFKDIRDAVPPLYRSWKEIQEMDPDIVDDDKLGLRFFWDLESTGSMKAIKLCFKGRRSSWIVRIWRYIFIL